MIVIRSDVMREADSGDKFNCLCLARCSTVKAVSTACAFYMAVLRIPDARADLDGELNLERVMQCNAK